MIRHFAWFAFVALAADGLVAQRGAFGRGDPAAVWRFFAERHDKDRDGKITLAEYARGEERFAALDRDADGAITREDFARRGRRRGGRRPAPRVATLAALVRAADANDDGVVSRAEWTAHVARVALVEGDAASRSVDLRKLAGDAGALRAALDTDKDGELSRGELAAAHAMLDIDRDGVVTRAERQRRGPPREGELAPDFELRYVGKVKNAEKGRAVFRLSSFRGKRPVALIFGSYT